MSCPSGELSFKRMKNLVVRVRETPPLEPPQRPGGVLVLANDTLQARPREFRTKHN
jgi:hypothetical protein